MTHTPGPWKIHEEADELVIVGPREGCRRNNVSPAWELCRIQNAEFWDNPETEAEDRDNASLIAASPDLLEAEEKQEAAELAHANCPECFGDGIPELCEKCFPLFDDARVSRRIAIAKARGK